MTFQNDHTPHNHYRVSMNSTNKRNKVDELCSSLFQILYFYVMLKRVLPKCAQGVSMSFVLMTSTGQPFVFGKVRDMELILRLVHSCDRSSLLCLPGQKVLSQSL